MQNKRITIFTGPFGSGKTEVAVNFAIKLKQQKQAVGLIDLDIVNPYFRSRELTDLLRTKGIDIVSTWSGLEMADLPALSPRIFSLLQNDQMRVILDVGGDPVGARTLGRFQAYFPEDSYNMWLVVNPYRPGFSDPKAISMVAWELEKASKLKLTGIVDNANLGQQTNLQTREKGSLIVDSAAQLLNLPVVIKTYTDHLNSGETCSTMNMNDFHLKLFMLPPWEVY